MLNREGRLDWSWEELKKNRYAKQIHQEVLSEFTDGYNEYDTETKRRINHLLFSGTTSWFERRSDIGELEIRLRGDGTVKTTWEGFKVFTGRDAHLGVWLRDRKDESGSFTAKTAFSSVK